MKYFTRDSFNLRDRIQGASRHSIILKGEDGEKIFCHLKIFDKIMQNPTIEFIVQEMPAHVDPTGKQFDKSKWICAFLPTRTGYLGM